jgi:hypothetical protein
LFKKNTYLTVISIFAFVLSFFIPYFFNENYASFPAPVFTNNEAEKIYHEYTKVLYETSDAADKPSILFTSNYNVGKFLSDRNYSQDQIDVLAKKIPLYNVTVSGSYTLGIDPLTRDINIIDNVQIPVENDKDITSFVKFTLAKDPKLKEKKNIQLDFNHTPLSGDFDKKTTVYTYTYKDAYKNSDLGENIKVFVQDGNILKAERAAFVRGNTMEYSTPFYVQLIGLIPLLILIIMLLAVLIVFIVKSIRKTIISYKFAIFPGMVAFISSLIITSFDGYSSFVLIQSILEGVFVYLVLAAYSSRKNKLTVTEWKEPIFIGFLFASLLNLVDTLFYAISYKMGAWESGVDQYSVFMQDHKWLLLFYPIGIGLGAAVFEEVAARFYFDKVFRKVPVVIVALISSFIWASLHLFYEVYPWYLRIIELTIFIGPSLYYIYKKYGLKTSIATHYFFNSFFCSIAFLNMDITIGIISSIIALLPLGLLLLRKKQTAEVGHYFYG